MLRYITCLGSMVIGQPTRSQFPLNSQVLSIIVLYGRVDSAIFENCSELCRNPVHWRLVYSSVADPWHFGVDPDPDPRIHASD